MVDHFQDLKYVLQTLGLPVIGQVRLVEEDCSRIDVLSGAFASAHRAVQVEAGEALTAEQIALLAQLDQRLARVQQQTQAPLCSELAMRQSADWRQVRNMAREALVRFHWTLELPPEEVLESRRYLN